MEVDNIKPQVVLFVFPLVLFNFFASSCWLQADCCSWCVIAEVVDLGELFADRARAGGTSHVGKVPRHYQLMD